MPALNVQIAGGSTFNIDFPNYSSIAPRSEFVNAEVGTDNGFIRTKDGYCGVWTKSSSTAFHTPGQTNGGRTGLDGSVSIFATIERGITPTDSSTITYKITSAPVEALPLTLELYADIGGKPGELDATDIYLTSQTVTDTSYIQYATKFLPRNASIIIAVKTVAGCLDRVLLVTNMLILHSDLISFTGDVQNSKAGFQWKINQNQNVRLFEVQESTDGLQFRTIGFTSATTTQGFEQYALNTSTQVVQTRLYRLKTVYIDQTATYSKVIKLGGDGMNQGIVLKRNPVGSNLEFTYTSSTASIAEISVYSMTGAKLHSVRSMAQKGSNAVTINLGGTISPGTYVLEVRNGAEKSAVKFLKN
jgi:hypothetical protein